VNAFDPASRYRLRSLGRLKLAEESALSSGRDHVLRIESMLTRLVRHQKEKPGTGTSTGSQLVADRFLPLNVQPS